jgi:hypothetical protein
MAADPHVAVSSRSDRAYRPPVSSIALPTSRVAARGKPDWLAYESEALDESTMAGRSGFMPLAGRECRSLRRLVPLGRPPQSPVLPDPRTQLQLRTPDWLPRRSQTALRYPKAISAWDGRLAHNRRTMPEYLLCQRGWLTVERLPDHAPDLIPRDHVAPRTLGSFFLTFLSQTYRGRFPHRFRPDWSQLAWMGGE